MEAEYWLYPHETAEFAAELEDKQAAFYARLIERVDQPLLKELMRGIERQEQSHATTFRAIARANAHETEKHCWNVDVRRIFMSSAHRLESFFETDLKDTSSQELIELSMTYAEQMETLSILMCRRIKEAYPGHFAAMIDAIISQEKKHITMFEQIKARYDNGTLADAHPAWMKFVAGEE